MANHLEALRHLLKDLGDILPELAQCAATTWTAAGFGQMRLHLTHTSPAPIPGLLAGMEEELRKACAI
jgi:hypothetical protein